MILILIEIIINIIIKIIKNKKLKIFYLKKNVNKGKYLITIGNCISCHTLEGGKPFGGGYSIKTKFGIVNSPNITSNKKYGIGGLKLKNFIKLMKNGISKKGEFIIPIFPYKNFSKIKKKDLKEMFFFLKKTKNENILNKKNSLKFPIKYKKLIIFSRIIFLKKKKRIKKKIKSNIKRGKYISESLGHCNMCHTKINNIGKLNNFFKYKGGNKIENWNSSELNNNKKIKIFKIYEIYNLLKFGISKNKFIGGSMINVINKSLQYISKIDIKSTSKYIKNILNKTKFFKVKKNIKNKIFKNYKKKKIIYKKECKECHGKINLGNYPIFPKLIKKNNNIKNIKIILKLNENINTTKNKYSTFMKNFEKLNNNEIKNYLKIIKNLKKK